MLHASSVYPVNSLITLLLLQHLYPRGHLLSSAFYLFYILLHSSTFANKYIKPLCPFSNPDSYLAYECVHEIPLMNKTDEQSYMRTSEGLISLGEPLQKSLVACLVQAFEADAL